LLPCAVKQLQLPAVDENFSGVDGRNAGNYYQPAASFSARSTAPGYETLHI
jgi:hypothetical protein